MSNREPDDPFWEFIKKVMKDLGLWDFLVASGFTPEDEKMLKKMLNNMKFYGFTITMGPDGKPLIKEFNPFLPGTNNAFRPAPFLPRRNAPLRHNDYLLDIYDEGDKITIVTEVPGEENIDVVVDSSGRKVLIKTSTESRVAELPAKVDKKPLSIRCRNGICEIVLKKKKLLSFR
ncbi:hypothetical protein J4526_06265 [Desulfurococcaceae archaeon MEX13E-LK6-19]|nr:hypothetical protein J4526_06265 [Desulfurococcaceae archaeon MEX13E-LK6-19]